MVSFFTSVVLPFFIIHSLTTISSEDPNQCSLPPQLIDVLILQEGYIPNFSHYYELIRSGVELCNDDIRIGLATYRQNNQNTTECIKVNNPLISIDEFVYSPDLSQFDFKDPLAAIFDSSLDLSNTIQWSTRRTIDGSVVSNPSSDVVRLILVIPQDGRSAYNMSSPDLTCLELNPDKPDLPSIKSNFDTQLFRLLFLENPDLIPSTEEFLKQFELHGMLVNSSESDITIIAAINKILEQQKHRVIYISNIVAMTVFASIGTVSIVLIGIGSYAWMKYRPTKEPSQMEQSQSDNHHIDNSSIPFG